MTFFTHQVFTVLENKALIMRDALGFIDYNLLKEDADAILRDAEDAGFDVANDVKEALFKVGYKYPMTVGR